MRIEHKLKIKEALIKSHKLHPELWKRCFNSNFSKTGKEHPSYKNGSGRGHNYRKVVPLSIKLLGYNCQICNSSKNIDTHHKDSNPRNNPLDGSNWQRLCKSCHNKLHWKVKKIWKTYEDGKEFQRKWDIVKRRQLIGERMFEKFGNTIFVRTTQISEIFKLTRERIRQLRNENKIPYNKIGGNYFYPPNIRRRWINGKYHYYKLEKPNENHSFNTSI